MSIVAYHDSGLWGIIEIHPETTDVFFKVSIEHPSWAELFFYII